MAAYSDGKRLKVPLLVQQQRHHLRREIYPSVVLAGCAAAAGVLLCMLAHARVPINTLPCCSSA